MLVWVCMFKKCMEEFNVEIMPLSTSVFFSGPGEKYLGIMLALNIPFLLMSIKPK
jgi:hypothetical protein